jgi:hypothetical protein
MIVERVIPLWNATLSALRKMDWTRRIEFHSVEYGNLDEYAETQRPKRMDDENEYVFEYRLVDWKEGLKADFIERPNPQPYSRRGVDGGEDVDDDDDDDDDEDRIEGSEDDENVDLKRDYGRTGLQIITKLANIHLTPENPAYDGGIWHAEGQLVCFLHALVLPELTTFTRMSKSALWQCISLTSRTLHPAGLHLDKPLTWPTSKKTSHTKELTGNGSNSSSA